MQNLVSPLISRRLHSILTKHYYLFNVSIILWTKLVGDTDRQVWQVYLILPNQHVTWTGRPWSSTRTWPSRWRTLPLSVLLKHWKSIRLKRKLLFTSGKLFFFTIFRLFFSKMKNVLWCWTWKSSITFSWNVNWMRTPSFKMFHFRKQQST